MRPTTPSSLSRREFLADAGILAVGFTLIPRSVRGMSLGSGESEALAPSADALDSWLVIGRDDRVTVYAGKVELGTGVSTALRQIVAEELDVPLDRITWVQGDSQLTQIRQRRQASETMTDECGHPKHAALHLVVTPISGCDGFEPASR